MTDVSGDIEPLLLTIPEAARALAIGRTMLYELIGDRRIEVVHIGRCTRIPVDALRTYVKEQRRLGRRDTVQVLPSPSAALSYSVGEE